MTQHSAHAEHILIAARDACGDPALCAHVRTHAPDTAKVLVVAQVEHPSSHSWLADETVDRAAAQARLDATVRCLRGHGLNARGVLGDADPVQAIADALFTFPADEIVICSRELEHSHRFHRRVVERAQKRFAVPVTEVAVGPSAFAKVP
jgi:hypothetical protein